MNAPLKPEKYLATVLNNTSEPSRWPHIFNKLQAGFNSQGYDDSCCEQADVWEQNSIV